MVFRRNAREQRANKSVLLIPLPIPTIFFALQRTAKGEDARMFLGRRRQLNREDMRYATIFAYTRLANRFTFTFIHVLAYRNNFYGLLKSQCHCDDNFLVNVNGLMSLTPQRRDSYFTTIECCVRFRVKRILHIDCYSSLPRLIISSRVIMGFPFR